LVYLFLGISIVAEIFMESIEKITSKKVIVNVTEANGDQIQRKVDFWNATVANLTLMALGSSAPEILLAVVETVTNLGQCPGELGASTIVGSASFNLLVISGISIYAVSAETDTDEDRDTAMPLGVKRIFDMRVFAITCTSSLFAYIWLWIVLLDQQVALWEGILTFVYFFLLIGFAYGADRVTAAENEKLEGAEGKQAAQIPVIEYSAYEIYKDLLIEQRGNAPQDEKSQQKRDKMKRFLKETMNTDQIDKVSLDELKKVVEGEGMISRIKYRKQVNNFMTGKRPVIAKYEKMKLEHAHADAIDEHLKNEDFGFQCLHYSVSESSGKLTIAVINKKKATGAVRAATIDGDAKAGEDYEGFDGIIEFNGEYSKTFDVGIKDDDNWEPDEDFFVQLYDVNTNAELVGHDTKTRVTIIDDDKPGQIAF
jgi:solute carrier family 8 (sodium/calcium exchanger)